MILIDYGHLSSRILFQSILLCKPKKIKGKYNTEDFKSFMIHGILSSIGYFIKEFKSYGEVVVCLEGQSWRKKVFPDYKANRQENKEKSDINFDEIYPVFDEIAEALKNYFGVKTLRSKYAEGDDVIAVLSKLGSENKQKTLVVSSDKDFNQLFRYPYVDIYDPIKKEFRTKPKSLNEIENDLKIHILKGDATDNIPGILSNTVFSEEFKKYLRENNIFCEDPKDFFNLSVSSELIEKYDIYEVYKSGKNKGKPKGGKLIYKTTPLTSKKINDLLEMDLDDENCKYHQTYKRNKKLIDFNSIPSKISDDIIESFKNMDKATLNTCEMMNFCTKYNLKQLLTNISIFLVHEKEASNNTDW